MAKKNKIVVEQFLERYLVLYKNGCVDNFKPDNGGESSGT